MHISIISQILRCVRNSLVRTGSMTSSKILTFRRTSGILSFALILSSDESQSKLQFHLQGLGKVIVKLLHHYSLGLIILTKNEIW